MGMEVGMEVRVRGKDEGEVEHGGQRGGGGTWCRVRRASRVAAARCDRPRF